jgi:hypothetical protein
LPPNPVYSLLQTAGRTVDRIETLRSIAASAPRRPARASVPGAPGRRLAFRKVIPYISERRSV